MSKTRFLTPLNMKILKTMFEDKFIDNTAINSGVSLN